MEETAMKNNCRARRISSFQIKFKETKIRLQRKKRSDLKAQSNFNHEQRYLLQFEVNNKKPNNQGVLSEPENTMEKKKVETLEGWTQGVLYPEDEIPSSIRDGQSESRTAQFEDRWKPRRRQPSKPSPEHRERETADYSSSVSLSGSAEPWRKELPWFFAFSDFVLPIQTRISERAVCAFTLWLYFRHLYLLSYGERDAGGLVVVVDVFFSRPKNMIPARPSPPHLEHGRRQ